MAHYLLFTVDGQYIVRRRPSAGTTARAGVRRTPAGRQRTIAAEGAAPAPVAPTTYAPDLGARQAA